jgi:hypothetical protein
LFSVDWRKRLLHFGALYLRIIPEVSKVCLKLATSFHKVIFADDVVPVKDGACLVTGKLPWLLSRALGAPGLRTALRRIL